MEELEAIKEALQPSDRLYVADAMTGQDAIKSAGEFNRRVGVSGVVLTKLDGDARGGAALSVVSVVGVPIAFVGSGERLEDLEVFHPERVVSRVLGMRRQSFAAAAEQHYRMALAYEEVGMDGPGVIERVPLIESARHCQRFAVIGDCEIFEAGTSRSGCHRFDGVSSVGDDGVRVQVAAQV